MTATLGIDFWGGCRRCLGKLQSFSRSFVSQSLDLAVPVFDIHSLLELGPALQELGIEDAFSPQVTGDFSFSSKFSRRTFPV